MTKLFTVTAVPEVVTGAAFLLSPSVVVSLLLGASLEAPSGWVVGRVAGAALLALGVACWQARADDRRLAARGLVAALLLYNVAAVGILIHARLGWRLSALGLWPAVLVHATLAAWCVACLRGRRA